MKQSRDFARLIVTLFLLIAFLTSVIIPEAVAESVDFRNGDRAFIAQKWEQYKPTFCGGKYAAQPNAVSPFQAGSLSQDFLNDGIKLVNYYRFLCGLPDDIQLDAQLNLECQYGALVSAANNTISHNPTQPLGMDSQMFNLGAEACRNSNLGWGYGSIFDSINAYMSDSDPGNIPRLGHRRWILNPTMQKTGFGFVENTGGMPFTSMWAFDTSRPTSVDYSYIAYPSSGYFPLNAFRPQSAWSITLNPSKYKISHPANVSIVLTRLNDHSQWVFTSANSQVSDQLNYLAIDTGYYGVPNCIIFRPGNFAQLNHDDTFDVRVTGIEDANGNSTAISYRVSFFALEAASAAPPSLVQAPVTPAPKIIKTSKKKRKQSKKRGKRSKGVKKTVKRKVSSSRSRARKR